MGLPKLKHPIRSCMWAELRRVEGVGVLSDSFLAINMARPIEDRLHCFNLLKIRHDVMFRTPASEKDDR